MLFREGVELHDEHMTGGCGKNKKSVTSEPPLNAHQLYKAKQGEVQSIG